MLEAIATRVEAIAIRSEAIATRVEAIATSRKDATSRTCRVLGARNQAPIGSSCLCSRPGGNDGRCFEIQTHVQKHRSHLDLPQDHWLFVPAASSSPSVSALTSGLIQLTMSVEFLCGTLGSSTAHSSGDDAHVHNFTNRSQHIMSQVKKHRLIGGRHARSRTRVRVHTHTHMCAPG